MNLKKIIEENDSFSGKVFDLLIQFLIIVSILSFTLETLPEFQSKHGAILRITEIVCVIIFSIEYLLRIYVSDKKLSFLFSFYGLIDLLAILPFYISTGIDLRSIRIFRILRVFRVFKVFRYNLALNRFYKAYQLIKEELVIFFISSLFLIYISAVGIYYFENPVQPNVYSSIFHSLWWAVATLTTVGYGDIYPITVGGKIFTFFILMIGLGIVAVPSGLVASSISKVLQSED